MIGTARPQQNAKPQWCRRSPDRLPEATWRATLSRVRSEFQEMPCMRLTMEQARALFGLPVPAVAWILQRLEADGFLTRTSQGEYMRRPQLP